MAKFGVVKQRNRAQFGDAVWQIGRQNISDFCHFEMAVFGFLMWLFAYFCDRFLVDLLRQFYSLTF